MTQEPQLDATVTRIDALEGRLTASIGEENRNSERTGGIVSGVASRTKNGICGTSLWGLPLYLHEDRDAPDEVECR